MCRNFPKRDELLFSTDKGCKYKPYKCTVIVFYGKYELSFFIFRMYRIVVMKKHIMYILLWGNTQKEYKQHKATDYLDYLLSQIIILVCYYL